MKTPITKFFEEEIAPMFVNTVIFKERNSSHYSFYSDMDRNLKGRDFFKTSKEGQKRNYQQEKVVEF